MKIKNRDVLYALVDLFRERDEIVEAGPVAGRVMALERHRGERFDGRAVAWNLVRLERAKLVARRGNGWFPTPRGILVEEALSARDAHRGGTFAPLSDLARERKITDTEMWVVSA